MGLPSSWTPRTRGGAPAPHTFHIFASLARRQETLASNLPHTSQRAGPPKEAYYLPILVAAKSLKQKLGAMSGLVYAPNLPNTFQ